MISSEIIKKIAKIEEQLGVFDQKLLGSSFWRIIRFDIIRRHLNKAYGIGKGDTTDKHFNIWLFLRSSWSSLSEYFSLLNKKKCTVDNVIFAFPRLQKVNSIYLDKFTDPLIENSKISESYIIFQRHQSGRHKQPRCNSEKLIKTDFIELTSRLLGIALFPFVIIIFFNIIFKTYKKACSYFDLSYKDFLKFNFKLGTFLISYFFHYLLFKKLSPKRIFLVDREIFYPVILACKKLNITTYEIQHGVTHSWTILYSGKYDFNIDPDYFLSFGGYWKGRQFGMPLEKIVNIGWAYKNTIEKYLNTNKHGDNIVLVISEPAISENIILATVKLANFNSKFQFHVRLHPQEKLSQKSIDLVGKYNNIRIQDNVVESTIALIPYNLIIGVNSSVLFEALSLKKKVGIINFEGCNSNIKESKMRKSFFFIENAENFDLFLNLLNDYNSNEEIYSEFNKELFIKILS